MDQLQVRLTRLIWYFPPPGFLVRWLYMKLYCIIVQFLRGRFPTKKLSVPRGKISNYFMKFTVFRKLYRSISATLDIAYNIKKGFLVSYYIFPPQTIECKTIRTYIRIDYDQALNESVWIEILFSQWYEIKMMWNRTRAYLRPKICYMNCLYTYIAQSRVYQWKICQWKTMWSEQLFRLLHLRKDLYFSCIFSK